MKKILLLATALLLPMGVARAAPDDDFLAAREAFRVGDAVKLARYAKNLHGYVLEPYIAYWQLRLRLNDADPAEVRALLAQLKDTPVADHLRADWLRLLAMRQQWDEFGNEYPRLVSEDTELSCFALSGQLQRAATPPPPPLTPRGVPQPASPNSSPDAVAVVETPAPDDAVVQAARTLWFTGRDLPDACSTLFDTLAQKNKLTVDDVWARIRLALEAGNTGVANRVAEFLPASERPDDKALRSIATNPQRYLDHRKFDLKSRAGRETLLFAVYRLARTSPPLAAARWEKLGTEVTEAERRYVWGLIAALGAQRLDPNTSAWFERAGPLSDTQLALKARTELRAQRWSQVLAAIEAMSPTQSRESAWRYWKARALLALGHQAEARAVMTPLAAELDFYGQLAAEDLGAKNAQATSAYQPDARELAAISRLPGLQRAQAFYRLNLRFEGAREWNWTVRGLDDRQLLAAAEFAHQNELYDRAIYTAEKTRELHNYSMRYPTPYRELLKTYVDQQGLDEAWVYSLIRQESRFYSGARSSVGAGGLMQIMPKTARWIARKIGLQGFRFNQVADVDTNLNLGTWYLRHVYDELDRQPLLASAAYNAGPRRARDWRSPTAMEGAIYAETIPFKETRDYVKKVMSGSAYYSQQLGLALQSLKKRLGVIVPSQPGSEPPLDEPGMFDDGNS